MLDFRWWNVIFNNEWCDFECYNGMDIMIETEKKGITDDHNPSETAKSRR